MRLYSGRLIKNKISQQITNRQEMRDAVVMSVDSTNKYALVKIQGSNTSIKAWYPENWESTPSYLKPGNAVRINQPGGNKSRIEIVSMGILLPTAVPGGSVTPTPVEEEDTIIDGCEIPYAPGAEYGYQPVHLTAGDPGDAPLGDSFQLYVSAGTYRINGVTYGLIYIPKMDDATVKMDNTLVKMTGADPGITETGGAVTIDPPVNHDFWYASLMIGTDGVVDVVYSAPWNYGETVPDPPLATTDHIRIGWLLVADHSTNTNAAWANILFKNEDVHPYRIWAYWNNYRLEGNYNCGTTECHYYWLDIYLGVINQWGDFIEPGIIDWDFDITFLDWGGPDPAGRIFSYPRTAGQGWQYFTYETPVEGACLAENTCAIPSFMQITISEAVMGQEIVEVFSSDGDSINSPFGG
ncbi:MAG: hypothetical protein WC637_00560 [Victivallales bacterium]